jgi:hypothetical protein
MNVIPLHAPTIQNLHQEYVIESFMNFDTIDYTSSKPSSKSHNTSDYATEQEAISGILERSKMNSLAKRAFFLSGRLLNKSGYTVMALDILSCISKQDTCIAVTCQKTNTP